MKAANRETIPANELYGAKRGAENGIESAKQNSALDERYGRKDSINGSRGSTLNARRPNGRNPQALFERGFAVVAAFRKVNEK
ncbi:YegP family protein [Lysobacter firmicutimachus]|uniref:DUF1508 domain-containing protein n=1 Tax=Lysobacter firmicutimachus TaxID=1792846 RepID=A0ABU8CXE3_9GAMM